MFFCADQVYVGATTLGDTRDRQEGRKEKKIRDSIAHTVYYRPVTLGIILVDLSSLAR